MRTTEELQAELNAKGCVHLSIEESQQLESGSATQQQTCFWTYSQSVTSGDRTITKSASVQGVCEDHRYVFDILKEIVEASPL
jgi:hypothetical protein